MNGAIVVVLFSIVALAACEPPRFRSFSRQQRFQPQRTSVTFERQEIQPEEPKPSYGPPAPSYGPPEYVPPAPEQPTTTEVSITTAEPQSEPVPVNTTTNTTAKLQQPQNNFFIVLPPQPEKYVLVNNNEPLVAVTSEQLVRVPSEPVFAAPAGIPSTNTRIVPARILQAPTGSSRTVAGGAIPGFPFASSVSNVVTPFSPFVQVQQQGNNK
ncbi:pollen-specific leucine-rich repeat extensin-like protein 2 [Agrilus planipennis]|uniref:Pollen-specific leucine-rich repeat extensin-like protein 2 n=1 Tax=Agrilus planipennis TaxID=224129 RepID=A0A1W4WQH0_AGRPL|nr:pollen-specific leucine-rich repeat extensin-like protein 2 [Agrilus planipennis]